MARRPSVQVRVHPDLAKLLKRAQRAREKETGRPVGLPEVTGHLAAYLTQYPGAHSPESLVWASWRPFDPARDAHPSQLRIRPVASHV